MIGKKHNEQIREMAEKDFYKFMFIQTPFLRPHKDEFKDHYNNFLQYLGKIPRFGAIVLNSKCDKALVVLSWNKKNWDFPKGKVNEAESHSDCAIREVFEEVNFDIRPYLKQKDFIALEQNNGKLVKLFIIQNIDNAEFSTENTRKEIAQC